jgi:phytoene dehydrogenase-like protein
MKMAESPRVIVVGGGLAGLVAANTAVDQGAQVTLLESGSGFGGRALTQVRDGYHFNLGPHALYKNAAGAPVLEQLEIVPDGEDAPLDGALTIFEGNLFALPISTSALLRTRVFSLMDKLEIMKVLGGLGKLDASAYDGVSFSQALKALTRRPRVQMFLSAIARLSTYSHAPDQVCAAAILRQIQAGNSGVLYLHKGWQSLVDLLVVRAKNKGVTLKVNAKVSELVPDQGGFALKDKSGRSWVADSVVLAVPPKQLRRLGGDAFGIAVPEECSVPIHLASLDLGLSHLPDPARKFALGLDHPVYFSVHSETADLAPPGGALIHVSRYIGRDESPDPAVIEAELEAVADLVQPGWRDHVVHRYFRPGLTVSHAMPLASQGGLSGRLPVSSTDRPNLHFAGDWIGATGLLADAAIVSGAEAGIKAAELQEHMFPLRQREMLSP